MHICVSKLTIIGSDNGLSPGRHQAIIWTNAGILFIGPLGTNFSEILIEILKFSFKKMRLKVSSGKWRPYCLGLNVLSHWGRVMHICISKVIHHWFRWWLIACSALYHCQLDPKEHTSIKLCPKFKHFHSRECIWKCRPKKFGHTVATSTC